MANKDVHVPKFVFFCRPILDSIFWLALWCTHLWNKRLQQKRWNGREAFLLFHFCFISRLFQFYLSCAGAISYSLSVASRPVSAGGNHSGPAPPTLSSFGGVGRFPGDPVDADDVINYSAIRDEPTCTDSDRRRKPVLGLMRARSSSVVGRGGPGGRRSVHRWQPFRDEPRAPAELSRRREIRNKINGVNC